MSRTNRTIAAGVLALGSTAVALALLPTLLPGFDSRPPEPGKLIVHEWGTFTSFSGSDGVHLEYRPLVAFDLPPFVNSPLSKLVNPFAMQRVVAQQRMETPVLYFYTDSPRSVDVHVGFPEGMLSEWYPPVESFATGVPNLDAAVRGDLPATPPAQPAKQQEVVAEPVAASRTEYFTVARELEPVRRGQSITITGSSFLQWSGVRLIPPDEFAAVRVRNAK